MKTRKTVKFLLTMLAFVGIGGIGAQEYGIDPAGDIQNILPLWEQAKFMEKQLKWRQKHVLPEIMRREGIDMWIVGRNEGVTYLSLVPGKQEGLVPEEPSLLIFYDRGEELGVELVFGEFEDISKIVPARRPGKIGVNERNK